MLLLLLLAQAPVVSGFPSGPMGHNRAPFFSGYHQNYVTSSAVNVPLADFEFSNAAGTGLGAACACVAVTAATGEAVTDTRASNATCTKEGLATTGLTNSSQVECLPNQIRVEAGSDGVLGVLVEDDRFNNFVQASQFDVGPWGTAASGVSAPIITPNAAIAPDGQLTAERIQVPACPGINTYSLVLQFNATRFLGAEHVSTIYLKGNGASGLLGFYNDDGTGPFSNFQACAYVAGSWSRCELDSMFTNTIEIGFGCINVASYPGTFNTGVADVFVVAAQYEFGLYPTSFIPTDVSIRERKADLVTIPVAPLALGSLSFVRTGPAQNVAGAREYVSFYGATTSDRPLLRIDKTASGFVECDGQGLSAVADAGATTTGSNWCAMSAPALQGSLETVVVGPVTGVAPDAGTLFVIGGTGTAQANSIISQVCGDRSTTRCR